ncbi:sphingomyelin phosphodiesterase [Chryseolinea soli]|uniref:Endonuclease/exonuclease/phosphatase domain-containing protein n=1 Tax=Chryseolinea soli TaxID=2321403 RepID=A0A385SK42_9BACT|nr:sphingomyelin phosphodiesterase [Chryseolinea soli]AYB31609.1 hypothetical protein D4L85_13990 [Chryseolinea soli]
MKPELVFVIFLLTSASAFCQSADTAPSTSRKIKILSWNIYMLPGIVKVKGREARAAAIGKILAQSDYDIIVFQEAFHQQARHQIHRYLDAVYPYQAGPANRKLLSCRTNSGLWIFSKYPITGSHAIIFKNRSGIDAFSRKGGLLAEITVDHQPIQIVGTHLQSSGRDWIRHSQCVEFYHKLLKEYGRPYVPQIICGDFNINKKNEDGYGQMLQILKASDGELSGSNFYSFDPLENDLKNNEGEPPHLIDYVLLRNNEQGAVTFLRREIKTIRQQWCPKHADLSDHFALEAELLVEDGNLVRK